jgi:cold shock protein
MLISRISRRISNGTVGRPQRCRDFPRQYDLKPARCQRITVSGFTIVSALMVFGTKRYSPTKIRRSIKPDAGGEDIFFHVTSLPAGVKPKQGDNVSFELGVDRKTGRSRAERVSLG